MRFITKVDFNKNIEASDQFCKFDIDPVPQTIEEHLKLSGWVIGIETPAVGIELIQDGQLVGEALLTIHRPRAAKIYATFPGAEHSGFIVDIPLENINCELGKISIQAVLEDFKRIPLADLNLSTAEESNQDLAEVQAEFHNTREELERLQSQFDEVLAELEETHLQLHQIKQTQSEKAISTNLEEKMNPENTSAKHNKVFCIGLSKTATASLTQAMKILGYKTKHYLLNPDVDLTVVNHDFVSDMPIQTRYKEYDKKYPGSKFILTVRNKESWLKSCSKHFRDLVRDKNSLRYKYRIEQTGIDGYDEDVFSKTYDQHIEEVKEYFKNREVDLLIIDICAGDGWDKLCEFLGKEVPKQPFPKENVSKSKQASSVVTQPVPEDFDKNQDLANSPELQKASINSNDKVNKHGKDSGWTEKTKDKFNPALYIASNARLIESIGYDLEAARKHYLEEGYQNNWLIDLFNPQSYLSKYKDLSNAFGDDLGGATRHYIVNGYKEGRFWTNNLSVVEAVLQREPEHKGARKEKFLTAWKMLQNPQVNTEILSKAMTNRIGIGVITYNRLEYLKGCIKNIQQYTQSPYYLIIADDGSTDGTVEWCRSEGLVVITGQNRGVCWNKNRALYALEEYTDANCIMLLEDDCWPTEKGWELSWLQTTAIWHHVNYAPPWVVKHNPDAIYQKSEEMPTCPYLLKLLTGQCTTSSRQALNCVGYLDSRFQGYGHGHVEWTKRFMRCSSFIESLPVPIGETYPAINTGLTTQKSISYSNEAERQKNAQILNSLANEPIYRSPWQNDEEKFLFLQEANSVQYPLLQQVSRVSSAIWFNTLNPSPQISTAQIVEASVKEAQLPTPRMSEAEVTLFTKYLQEQKVVIEFGAGGSTGLAIKTEVKQLYTVESDLEFIKKLQEYTLIQKAVEEGQVQFFHINIGPVRAWGFPRDQSLQENWPKYYLDIWKEVSQPIDLVFIDGRFRVACALQSLSHINKNTKVIMHDFWDRPFYHDVLKFFDPIESADTLVVLQPKSTIDHHLLSPMIEQYKYIAA